MQTKIHVVWVGALLAVLGCGHLTPEDFIDQTSSAVGGQPAMQQTSPGPVQVPIQQGRGGSPSTAPEQLPIQQGRGGSPSTAPVQQNPSTSCSQDLMQVARSTSPDGNWIGGAPDSSSDNPCGFQGAFYAYSDAGADEIPGNADDSLAYPAPVEGSLTERGNPCAEGRCCIRGTTTLWPREGTAYFYTTWGAGIGLSLNELGYGMGRQAYTGPAVGFGLSLSGKLSGQSVRIGFTQSATDASAPFVATTTLGKKAVMFTDPACPSWSTECIDPGMNPYDLQIQIVGGETAGPYEVCIDGLRPLVE